MFAEKSQEPARAARGSVSLLKRHAAALVASGFYAVLTTVVLMGAWRASDGHFIYALDDTYIGMAMARNLALHGVWGVTQFAFTSSDSSLLFPLLMAAGFRIFGVQVWVPLAISWTAGLLSIFAAESMLRRYLGGKAQTVALLFFVLFALVFVVGVIGMEHSLHLLFTLLFLDWFVAERRESGGDDRVWPIALISALMVAARYEGLFFVAPAVVILGMQRRWRAAVAITVGAAVPMITYAAFSLAHGAYWLPNSVALKGAGGDHPGLLRSAANIAMRAGENYREGIQLFLLLACVGLAAAVLWRKTRSGAVSLLLVLGAGCLHICLAQVGMYYRYDSYLFGAGIVLLACMLPTLKRAAGKPLFLFNYALLLVTGGCFMLMATAQIHMLPLISRNIWLRQWQMGRFVEEYYPTANVAANDIGAVNYLSDIHCYDLVGLANQDVFNARRSGRYTTQFLAADAAAQHVQIAIAYDRWFSNPPGVPVGGPPLPSSWIRVAHWELSDPSIIGDHVVSFYAVDPEFAPGLRAAVIQFAHQLPENVSTIPD